ncbi:hypothetical protein SMDB11_1243 [Serratia marcescens subsp. marcescens Db11]|uniref:Colicin immunity protein n=1 Tax=Serratia marcescens subsp. marcescens Db11 TaxID=273526 RepID=A0ABC9IGI3_SERMA|nr:hypothetical protein SMDB11_1243 [Serratia marcescens subsp. marcescens Db11]
MTDEQRGRFLLCIFLPMFFFVFITSVYVFLFFSISSDHKFWKIILPLACLYNYIYG